MRAIRRSLQFLFVASVFLLTTYPVVAQQVIATVPVGSDPLFATINPVTNRIYVTNSCGDDPTCLAYPLHQGTVSVIDGGTNGILASINVGYQPYGVAVNPVSNKTYVANLCGTDSSCSSTSGTISVIDGINPNATTIALTMQPFYVTVNSVTNKIYAVGVCLVSPCEGYNTGRVTVIDGASDTVIDTVSVGFNPQSAVVNPVTNKIYVANYCGNDPTCGYPRSPGTVTVIDGATDNTTTVPVGTVPQLDVDTATNKIYVANYCGDDPDCNSETGTMTVIDGDTLLTTEVAIGGALDSIAVNSATNTIYIPGGCFGQAPCGGFPNGMVAVIDGESNNIIGRVATGPEPYNVAINSVTNKIFVANFCGLDPTCVTRSGTVTVIDGATLAFLNLNVGAGPFSVTVNSTTNRIYVPNYCGSDPTCNTYSGTVSVIDGNPPSPLQFVSLAQPCRAVDTRPPQGGGPIQGGTSQDFVISGSPACGTLPSAAAYSMNVTVVPQGRLGYLTVWPTGQPQPLASTLNSLDGRVKANAAIMPAGTAGKVSVYATDTTNVILDINGYFAPVSTSTLAFYPLAPCRVADTRNSSFPQGLGPPGLTGGMERVFPILSKPQPPAIFRRTQRPIR